MRQRTLLAGQNCAQRYRELLITILQGNSVDAKHTLPPISRQIAQSVTELITAAELLKGKHNTSLKQKQHLPANKNIIMSD